ncbi:MAG TPA: peptide chain release factor N(5)-glutamine methyltransferase [Candidatus Cloacimonetes bacterium]|nr:peptide chain release factor N(5)-glutamine methyltransferase [Candidatus Cloacimonadota bacterium]HEX37366.1 peptide chain release factor N(5)-glutamine methyltransferase [Candidatus Cloacimonadota bacterium]
MAAQGNKTWTVKDVLFWTSDYFTEKEISSPHLNAELLIAHVLDCSRLDLYLKYDKPLSDAERETIKNLIKKRITHYPLQYILGEVEFYGNALKVEEGVLIPRPETELLIDSVLTYIKENARSEWKLLDIGTGSGNIPISLSIALSKSNVNINITASDISEKSLSIAQKNSEIYDLKNITFIQSNLFDNINGNFNCIISNPPYISEQEFPNLPVEIKDFEPKLALLAQHNGLEFYDKILQDVGKHLDKDGVIFFEIGASQKQDVSSLAERYNFKIIDSKKDYNDFDRVLVLSKNR